MFNATGFIKAPIKSTGGIITVSGNYVFHSFITASGNFVTPVRFSSPIQYLIVGGGGGGGASPCRNKW